jgi:hypothetical protein
VRLNEKFEAASATVKEAFAWDDRPRVGRGRRLKILRSERLEKTKGLGHTANGGYFQAPS